MVYLNKVCMDSRNLSQRVFKTCFPQEVRVENVVGVLIDVRVMLEKTFFLGMRISSTSTCKSVRWLT